MGTKVNRNYLNSRKTKSIRKEELPVYNCVYDNDKKEWKFTQKPLFKLIDKPTDLDDNK